MPSYKLTYFNGKGRGELLRLLFAASKTKYEDVRVDMKDWPRLKESMLQGSLPELEVDGGKNRICQSQAIARYLARKFVFRCAITAACGVHWLHNQLVNGADPDETAPAGAASSGSSLFTDLYGKNEDESAIIDQMMDTCLDLFLPYVKLRFMKDEEVKKTGMKAFQDTTGPKVLGHLLDLMQQTGKDGYAVGKSLTMGDLVIYTMDELVFQPLKEAIGAADNLFDKYLALVTLKKMVENNDGVKEYLANRPKT